MMLEQAAREMYDAISSYCFNASENTDFRSTILAEKLEEWYAALARAEQSPQGIPNGLIPPNEVTKAMLSPETIELAHAYVDFVNAYEHHYGDSGYTPREMEMIRTLKHNELLAALQADGIDVKDRAATTDLARWIRE